MLIIGNLEISWFAVFTAVACFIGVCIACLLRFVQRKDISDIFTCVAFGIPLGLVSGRILYIIFSGSGLTGLGQYLNLTNGGYGLYGVFFGVFLGALIAVRYFYADGLGSLLDCLSIGGAFAITVGSLPQIVRCSPVRTMDSYLREECSTVTCTHGMCWTSRHDTLAKRAFARWWSWMRSV